MLVRAIALVALLVVATLAYLWWNRRQGVVRQVEIPGALTPADLGAARGARATLVQFSTPMCAKCPPTKALLVRIAAEYPGVVHTDIDAEQRLDLARRLDIMRTPTTLLLDADGVVVARMNGAPNESQVRSALDALPPGPDYSI